MSFASDLEKISKKAGATTEETRRAIVDKLFTSVVLDTPVDTGRLRGNWQPTLTHPAGGALGVRGDAAVIAEIKANLGNGDVTNWLTNNLPYARRIEFGYSRKAPDGMVRKNVARIRQIIKQASNGIR